MTTMTPSVVFGSTSSFNTTMNNINGPEVCQNFDTSPAASAVQLIMSFIILVLNVIVVSVVVGGPKSTYRKPAFVFIASLATSDLLLGLALVGFGTVALGKFELATRTWVILTASTSVCFNASVNFLLVIAADRLCFIGYNTSYSRFMSKRNVWLLIALCWVVAVIPVLPLLTSGEGTCINTCKCFTGMKLNCSGDSSCSTVIVGFKKSFLFGLFFYFLVMLISIGIIYYILFAKVLKHANKIKSLTVSKRQRGGNNMKREYRLARTLGIVVAVFFFCWTPLMLLYVIDFANDPKFAMNADVVAAISSLAVLNSVCNPIIYAARIPRMRRYMCPCARRGEETSTDGSAHRRSVHGKRGVYSNGRTFNKPGKMENSKANKSQASSKDFSSTSGADQCNETSRLQRSGTVTTWLENHLACISGRNTSDNAMEMNGDRRNQQEMVANPDENTMHDVQISPNMNDDGIEILDETPCDNVAR